MKTEKVYLESASGNVTPVEHVAELCRIFHVSFKCGQEDLRGVAEDDDAQCYGEGSSV